MALSSVQWLVLDNLLQGWPYAANVERDAADKAYLWLVNNGHIKDGKVTPLGRSALLQSAWSRLSLGARV